MILSFINIRKVPWEVAKTSGFALGFQHLPQELGNVNEWKIMFDSYNTNTLKILFQILKIHSGSVLFYWNSSFSQCIAKLDQL